MPKQTRVIDADGNLPCSKCKAVKPVSEFNRDRINLTGYASQCKVCKHATVAASYRKHRDKTRARRAEYRKQNHERFVAYGKDYYRRNIDYFRGKYRPHIGKADKAVQTAKRRGLLPKIDTMYCVECFGPAQQYHHQSYMESDRLCVVPVCISCHVGMNLRRPDGNRNLGIFPTSLGIVRIAIASTIDNHPAPSERVGDSFAS
jgi:hypothetical protein